jgi:predicted kinase
MPALRPRWSRLGLRLFAAGETTSGRRPVGIDHRRTCARRAGSRLRVAENRRVSSCGAPGLVVVVTGVPGSGKTTLGRALAHAAGAHFLALDGIKERLFESSHGTLSRVALRLAAEAELGAALAAVAGAAVVDIWIQPGRDTTRVAELLASNGSPVVEIMCRVPAEVAVCRYRKRARAGPHMPPDEQTLQRIRAAAATLVPLGLGSCVEVDTTVPVDVGRLAATLQLHG